MALDGHVRCKCIREGRAKPHPFPDSLIFDETGEPVLADDSADEDWEAHDLWVNRASMADFFSRYLWGTSRGSDTCVHSCDDWNGILDRDSRFF